MANRCLAIGASLCWSVLFQAEGAVINARGLSREDVGSAVFSARNGDTVVVPPGREVWKSTLTVNKAITLQFAGIGQSIIVDDIATVMPNGNPGWSQAVICFNTEANKFCRLTGLEIDPGAKRAKPFFHGKIQIHGSTTAFRVDHCALNQLDDTGIYVSDSACGVIDHCLFNGHSPVHAIAIMHQSWANQPYGDGSWDTPAELGTSNAVFMEDNVFTSPTPGDAWAVLDSFAGARWVFRYNKVSNGWISNHGTESTAFNRGTRSCEIYMNTLSDPHFAFAIEFRSATGVVWSNTASGYKNRFCKLSNFRSADSYKFWGAANGTNPFDKNAPDGPFLTVTQTGANQPEELMVANANWTVNQWVGYAAVDASEPGVTNFGTIYSNTATTAYLLAGNHPHVFNTGDTVKFYKVIYALDMPGMGICGKLSRGAGGQALGSWPNQKIEPIYSWGNTMDGAKTEPTTPIPTIVPGVQFINDTPKPGYVPFTYPHPLTLRP